MAGDSVAVYKIVMVRKRKDLDRLAEELRALTPEERAEVMGKAAQHEEVLFKPLPKDFQPPRLKLGGAWTGGSLRREDLYDDDGR